MADAGAGFLDEAMAEWDAEMAPDAEALRRLLRPCQGRGTDAR